MKDINLNKAVSVFGKILMLLAFVFIIRRLSQYDVNLAALASPWILAGLFTMSLLVGVGMVFAAVNFGWIVENLSGIIVDPGLVRRVYCGANLYKYIPGSVMYFLGRNRLAVESEDLSHGHVAVASVMEGIFVAIAALLLILVTVSDHMVAYLNQTVTPPFVRITSLVLLTAIIIVVWFLRDRIKNYFSSHTEGIKNLRIMVAKRLSAGLLLLVVLALTFLATLMLLGQHVELRNMPIVLGLFILSWLIGFMTPGVSGGFGVREAVMLMFAGHMMDEGILISAMILHRVVCIIGDVMAFGMAHAYGCIKFSKLFKYF